MSDDIVARLRWRASLGKRTGSELSNDCTEAAGEIERLRAALREVAEVYAGSEGIPQPITAAEGYLVRLSMEMFGIARAALGEKKDD